MPNELCEGYGDICTNPTFSRLASSHFRRGQMRRLTGQERAAYVQNMFTRIARRYDLMNRLMTGGQDIGWRRRVIQLARLNRNSRLLDLGTGTGDLAREALAQFPQARVIAADFTLEMMRVGQK